MDINLSPPKISWEKETIKFFGPAILKRLRLNKIKIKLNFVKVVK